MNNGDYDATFLGPILLTGPHTTSFSKGDGSLLQTQRDHFSELYIASVIVKLATEINNIMGPNSASYMIWRYPREKSVYDLDPNYLNDEQQEHSAFHWGLHKFAENNVGKPVLHLDFHGKGKRSGA